MSSKYLYDSLAQIQRVGFFGFMREVVGLVDLEREREDTEKAYRDLVQDYNTLAEGFRELQTVNQQLCAQLEQEVAKQAEIEKAKREMRDERLRLLQPPRPLDVFRMCNQENCFTRPTVEKGILKMAHDRKVYPCDMFLISLGELRLCDQHGYPVNLMQNYAYEALPRRQYGQPLIPDKFEIVNLRVLFGTETEEGFWMRNPLDAQDVMVELRTHVDSTTTEEKLYAWAEQEEAHLVWSGGRECIIDRIVPFSKFLNQSRPGGFSERNADKVREQCYAEYLELYFHDGRWD